MVLVASGDADVLEVGEERATGVGMFGAMPPASHSCRSGDAAYPGMSGAEIM